MCKAGKIPSDKKVFGIPILNYLAKRYHGPEQQSMRDLLKCLISTAKCEHNAEGQWSFAAGVDDAPIEFKTCQVLPPALLPSVLLLGVRFSSLTNTFGLS